MKNSGNFRYIGENWIEFIARSSMMIHLYFNHFVPFLEYLEYFLGHNHRLCFIFRLIFTRFKEIDLDFFKKTNLEFDQNALNFIYFLSIYTE